MAVSAEEFLLARDGFFPLGEYVIFARGAQDSRDSYLPSRITLWMKRTVGGFSEFVKRDPWISRGIMLPRDARIVRTRARRAPIFAIESDIARIASDETDFSAGYDR